MKASFQISFRIEILIRYFNETWALCLFHDQFPVLAGRLTDQALGADNEIKAIMDSLMALNAHLSDSQNDEIYDLDRIMTREQIQDSMTQ